MMTGIKAVHPIYAMTETKSVEAYSNFNEKVLAYIRTHLPEGDLTSLFETLKQLSPDHTPGLAELSGALLYADSTLRLEGSDEMHAYTQNTLDSLTTQALGTSYFYNSVLNDVFFPDEERESKPESF